MQNARVMAADGLDFDDYYGVQRLKYLRNRSLSNPRYRDAPFVRKFVTRKVGRWTSESPLEPLRIAVERCLDDYDRAAKREDGPKAEQAWGEMLVAVDALLAEGDRVEGRRIPPR